MRFTSDRRRILWLVSVGFLVGLILVQWRPNPSQSPLHLAGATMGTTYNITALVTSDATVDSVAVHDSVQAVLDQLESLASTYDSESELSRFNQSIDTVPHPITPSLAAVFEVARIVSERSGGAFDVTVGPLVEAWGFGASTVDLRSVPPSAAIDSLRLYVGYQYIELDLAAGLIAKRRPHVTADLSAVAKGYGVDLVSEALERMGFANFLVEIGGEMMSRGARPDGAAWRVGIESPDPASRSAGLVVEVRDQAVATSGDYRNYQTIDGVRYSHIVDPRTGWPLRYQPSAVTVLHSSAARADAWATALSVLGADSGLAVAGREGLAVVFQLYEDSQIVIRRSSAFHANAKPLKPSVSPDTTRRR